MYLRVRDPAGAARGGLEGGFRRDIEGLRALAILLVVAYHAGVPGMAGGYIGVDVFFVVSGYLITGLLVTEIQATGRVDFPGFYARRVRRLLPAALIVVVATLLAGRLIYAPGDHGVIASAALATSLYVSNIHFALSATDYLADPGTNPLLHTWSLGVEEQFYFFWPAIVLAGLVGFRGRVRRGRLALTLAVIAALSYALCIWQTGVRQPWAFFLLPTRAWEFALGALACLLPARAALGTPQLSAVAWAGLAAIIAAGMGFGSQTVFPGAVAVVPVAGTALVLAAGDVTAAAGPSRLLGLGPMQWIGRMSYSWYLWHWPVLTYARAFPSLKGVPVSIALSAMALGLAAVTHVLIENPVRFSASLRPRPWRSLLLGLTLTLGGASASYLMGAAGRRAAESPGQAVYREAHDLPAIYADGCHLGMQEARLAPCGYGDTGGRASIVLFGDSHAAQWFPALEEVAREHGLRLVSLTKSACPVARVRIESYRLGRVYAECEAWREAAVTRILELAPLAVVLSQHSDYIAMPGERDRWYVSAEEWRAGLAETVARFDSAGLRTILLADTPFPRFNVLSCLARAAWNPALHRGRCEFPRSTPRLELAHRIDREVAAASRLAEVVDLTDTICATDPCRPEVDGVVVYRDAHHLTTRFAAGLAWLLERRLLVQGR